MQTLTIGRSTYKLSPSRNVGELQAKLSKFTGKTKKTIIAKERRSYPIFKIGQSTSEYVNSFYGLNDLGALHMYGPLNTDPCTLYSGADLHEIMDAVPGAEIAPPAAPEPAADVGVPEPAPEAVAADPGTDAERFEVARVRFLAPMLLERFGVSLPENVPMSGTAELLRLGSLARAAASNEVFGPTDPAPAAAAPAVSIIPADTLREMNQAHGIATEQIRAIKSYSLGHTDSHVAGMLRAEAERYGRRSDEVEPSEAWARIYRQISDTLRAAAEFLLDPDPTPPAAPIAPADPLEGFTVSFGGSVIHQFTAPAADPDPSIIAPDAADRSVYAEWTGFPIGGYYALNLNGTTLKDTPDGKMPRRFRTSTAADTYARKHHRKMARITRREPTVSPLPRVLYSEFIRSASKREAPMMA